MSVRAARPIRLDELASLVDGRLEGDPERRVRGFASLDEAGGDDVSFCSGGRWAPRLTATRAAAVIIAEDLDAPEDRGATAWIRVADPHRALATALARLVPERRPAAGVDATAVVADDAELGAGVHVGPRAVVGGACVLGDRTVVHAGCVLAPGVRLGEDCVLHPGVTLYEGVWLGDRVVVHGGAVLGADGFGYARDGGRHVKIPQRGGVRIGDDVEIGANACIDRGTLDDTRVGAGTKIDNLVQIGHNCVVGSDCILCGQVGLGGTTRVGDGVMIGGQAGLSGHLEVGERAMIAAQTGVISDVPAHSQVAGYPQQEAAGWRRAIAALRRLPELVRRVRRLEAAVDRALEEEE